MKKLQLFILITLMLSASSCKKWLTVEPKTETTADKLFASTQGYQDALTGVYINLRKNYSPASFMTSGGIENMANLWYTYTVGAAGTDLTAHNYTGTLADAAMGGVFINDYNALLNINTLLEALSTQNILDPTVAKLTEGEALALRAFISFDLIRIWGPMPNKIGTKTYLPYVTTKSKANYTYDTYTSYMTKLSTDLDKAEQILKQIDPILKYSNTALNVSSTSITEYKTMFWYYRQNRMNYYGVLGLQARLKLWMGDKTNALKYAKMVVDAVNPDNTKKFTFGTANDANIKNYVYFTEHLFGLNIDTYSDANSAAGRSATIVTQKYKITDLYGATSTDIRLNLFYTNTSLLTGVASNSTRKYADMVKATGNVNPFSIPLIRLSEMYLIISECASIPEANSYFQTFMAARSSASAPLTDTNRNDLLLNEYIKEFYGEGQAFFAYKRYGTLNMKWSNHTTDEAQYVPPLPTGETTF